MKNESKIMTSAQYYKLATESAHDFKEIVNANNLEKSILKLMDSFGQHLLSSHNIQQISKNSIPTEAALKKGVQRVVKHLMDDGLRSTYIKNNWTEEQITNVIFKNFFIEIQPKLNKEKLYTITLDQLEEEKRIVVLEALENLPRYERTESGSMKHSKEGDLIPYWVVKIAINKLSRTKQLTCEK